MIIPAESSVHKDPVIRNLEQKDTCKSFVFTSTNFVKLYKYFAGKKNRISNNLEQRMQHVQAKDQQRYTYF